MPHFLYWNNINFFQPIKLKMILTKCYWSKKSDKVLKKFLHPFKISVLDILSSAHSKYILDFLFLRLSVWCPTALRKWRLRELKRCSTGANWGEYWGKKWNMQLCFNASDFIDFDWWELQLSTKIIILSSSTSVSLFYLTHHCFKEFNNNIWVYSWICRWSKYWVIRDSSHYYR